MLKALRKAWQRTSLFAFGVALWLTVSPHYLAVSVRTMANLSALSLTGGDAGYVP